MRDTVLVLTNSRDGIHTDIVIEKATKLGSRVFRCDVDKLSSGEITINFYANADAFGFKMVSGGQAVDSKHLKSIWYRRPNQFNLGIRDPVQKK